MILANGWWAKKEGNMDGCTDSLGLWASMLPVQQSHLAILFKQTAGHTPEFLRHRAGEGNLDLCFSKSSVMAAAAASTDANT